MTNQSAYYAAVFAEDLVLELCIREILGHTLGVASLSVLVGTTMHTANELARNNGEDFWPVAGAERAAWYLNGLAEPNLDLDLDLIRAEAIKHALVGGFTEGKSS